jgi:hypothetical protein
MLLYAWQLARFRGRVDVEHESSPELEFLLARVLVETTSALATIDPLPLTKIDPGVNLDCGAES